MLPCMCCKALFGLSQQLTTWADTAFISFYCQKISMGVVLSRIWEKWNKQSPEVYVINLSWTARTIRSIILVFFQKNRFIAILFRCRRQKEHFILNEICVFYISWDKIASYLLWILNALKQLQNFSVQLPYTYFYHKFISATSVSLFNSKL